jgi:hypothetical protein
MPSLPRKLLEERFSQLADDVDACLENESACRAAVARRELAEWLNQAVRRLRQSANLAEIAGVLTDSSSPFCNGAAVFGVNESVEGIRARGLGEYDAARFASLRFPRSAGAFASAAESGDPVVAMAGPAEVPEALVSLLGHPPGERVALFPLQVRGKTAGILYCWGDAQPAPLELLSHSAAAVLEALTSPPAAPPSVLVALEPAPAAPAAVPERSPAEQRTHLRAQRFARVAVAEMRLYHTGAVAAGRARSNLYAALRKEIDDARAAYRREFMPSPGMPDYLHQELLHALSNDDAGLLGENYPGPLV